MARNDGCIGGMLHSVVRGGTSLAFGNIISIYDGMRVVLRN